MPPRRAAHLKGLPLTLASTAESVEARVKRLRPQDQGSVNTPVAAACVGTSPWGMASSAAGVQAGSTEGCELMLLWYATYAVAHSFGYCYSCFLCFWHFD